MCEAFILFHGRRTFWGPPVADLNKKSISPLLEEENKLTDRAHPVGVCPGGVSRIKRKQTFFFSLFLVHFFLYISGSGGERSFLPRTLEGKKGFFLIF